jgi:CBS domain-containing protein
MRTVKNIQDVKDKPDNIISPDIMVIDALKKLISVNLSYLLVYEGEQFLGLFSERDYTRKLVLEGRSSRDTKVRDVMTTNLPHVSVSSTVEECMYQMNSRGTRYVAVYEGDNFTGIITIHDLLREVLANREHVFNDSLATSLLDNDESGKVF